VELAVTLRWLGRISRKGDVVAEIGVGGGHYTEFLARRGCTLHLIDISTRLLDAVEGKLQGAGFGASIAGRHQLSGTNLEGLDPETFDLVLLMGPLYHLQTLADRQNCVQEARRILKPGGALFATGINRLAYLRDLLRMKFGPVTDRLNFHQHYLRDGNLDPEHAPPLGYGHLTSTSEFLKLFEDQFEKMAFVGVESFTAAWQHFFGGLSGGEKEAWLDLVEDTNQTPEGLGQSDHFLYVGRKM
jgi:SAM-dependent methyltransferase